MSLTVQELQSLSLRVMELEFESEIDGVGVRKLGSWSQIVMVFESESYVG